VPLSAPTTLSWPVGCCCILARDRGSPRSRPTSPEQRGPEAGPSSQELVHAPNPRVGVLERSPSPSPDPPAYWPMEPSDSATSPRGHREIPCVIHGWGSCPYSIALRRMKLSSLGPREGGEGVTVIEEDDEVDPIEIARFPTRADTKVRA
jgi:hypothetical protein